MRRESCRARAGRRRHGRGDADREGAVAVGRDRPDRLPDAALRLGLERDVRKATNGSLERDRCAGRDSTRRRGQGQPGERKPVRAQPEVALDLRSAERALRVGAACDHLGDVARRGRGRPRARHGPVEPERLARGARADQHRPPVVVGRKRVVGVGDRDEVGDRRPERLGSRDRLPARARREVGRRDCPVVEDDLVGGRADRSRVAGVSAAIPP